MNTVKTEKKYYGKGCVSLEDCMVVINGPTMSKTKFPLNELDTPDKLLVCVYNQLTKEWVSTELIRRFIELVSQQNNLKIHG